VEPRTIANGSWVYLDAQAIICSVAHRPIYWPMPELMWDTAAEGDLTLPTGEFSLLECMVQPERNSDGRLICDFETMFESPRNL
jgi:hypothetical protein